VTNKDLRRGYRHEKVLTRIAVATFYHEIVADQKSRLNPFRKKEVGFVETTAITTGGNRRFTEHVHPSYFPGGADSQNYWPGYLWY